MGYGRRTRRVYRRNRKSRGGVLSTRSIYGNRSARAQANQIATLRKRVNRVSRRTRPDIKTVYVDAAHREFNNSMAALRYTKDELERLSLQQYQDLYPAGNSTNYSKWRQSVADWVPGTPVDITSTDDPLTAIGDAACVYERLVDFLGVGATNHTRVGDRIRINSISLKLNMQYMTDMGESTLQGDSAWVRVVVLQSKSQMGFNTVYNASSIVSHYANSGVNYDCLNILPLTDNITSNFWVCADKKFKLSTQYPTKTVKIPIRLHTRSLMFRDQNDMNGMSDHGILVYYFVNGLKWSATTTEVVYIDRTFKYTFTDV